MLTSNVKIAVITIIIIIIKDKYAPNLSSISPAKIAIGIVKLPSDLIGVIKRNIPNKDGIINFKCVCNDCFLFTFVTSILNVLIILYIVLLYFVIIKKLLFIYYIIF